MTLLRNGTGENLIISRNWRNSGIDQKRTNYLHFGYSFTRITTNGTYTKLVQASAEDCRCEYRREKNLLYTQYHAPAQTLKLFNGRFFRIVRLFLNQNHMDHNFNGVTRQYIYFYDSKLTPIYTTWWHIIRNLKSKTASSGQI